MTIKPLKNIVQLEFEEAKAGVLDTSSRESAVEFATVLAVGDGVGDTLNVGDKVFVKAFAVDIVSHDDKKYFFVNIDSKGILAKVN